MSSHKGGFLTNLIMIAGIFALALLLYVFLLEEVKSLNKYRLDQASLLEEKNNKIKQKIVQVQQLSSKERIIQMAQDSLDMVMIGEKEDTITINSEDLEYIERVVKKKYE